MKAFHFVTRSNCQRGFRFFNTKYHDSPNYTPKATNFHQKLDAALAKVDSHHCLCLLNSCLKGLWGHFEAGGFLRNLMMSLDLQLPSDQLRFVLESCWTRFSPWAGSCRRFGQGDHGNESDRNHKGVSVEGSFNVIHSPAPANLVSEVMYALHTVDRAVCKYDLVIQCEISFAPRVFAQGDFSHLSFCFSLTFVS